MSYLPEHVFGLPEHQLDSLHEEVKRDFERDLEGEKDLPQETKVDNGYKYEYFTTPFQLTKQELVQATRLFASISMAKTLIERSYEEYIDHVFVVIGELVALHRENNHDKIVDVCKRIKKEIMAILEDSNSVRTFVGLCKIHMAVNHYLSLSI